jgi:hypothetical protein
LFCFLTQAGISLRQGRFFAFPKEKEMDKSCKKQYKTTWRRISEYEHGGTLLLLFVTIVIACLFSELHQGMPL